MCICTQYISRLTIYKGSQQLHIRCGNFNHKIDRILRNCCVNAEDKCSIYFMQCVKQF